MVIDKSTGRGCALSIASKTISRQLIEDGIIGKPLLRKSRKQGYDLVRIVDKRGYYMNTNRQQVDELAGEPLWVPSFIDPNNGKGLSASSQHFLHWTVMWRSSFSPIWMTIFRASRKKNSLLWCMSF